MQLNIAFVQFVKELYKCSMIYDFIICKLTFPPKVNIRLQKTIFFYTTGLIFLASHVKGMYSSTLIQA